jgi:hypothetical protein
MEGSRHTDRDGGSLPALPQSARSQSERLERSQRRQLEIFDHRMQEIGKIRFVVN